MPLMVAKAPPIACPKCKRDNPHANTFCEGCGAQFAPVVAGTPAVTITWGSAFKIAIAFLAVGVVLWFIVQVFEAGRTA